MKAKYISLLLFCYFINISLKHENVDSKFHLKIDQIMFDNKQKTAIYIIENNRLSIQKYIVRQNNTKYLKVIYSKRISKSKLVKIKESSKKLLKLNNFYAKPSLGGFQWDINLIYDNLEKKIFLENSFVKEIDSVFLTINKVLPLKMHLIRMNCEPANWRKQ